MYCVSAKLLPLLGGASGHLPLAQLSDDTARDLLEKELSKPIYQERPSLLGRFLDWLQKNFFGLKLDPEVASLQWLVVALIVTVLVILIVILFTGSWRLKDNSKPKLTGEAAVFEDNRTAVQYLAAAKNALSREDYATAFLEQFRHLLRLSAANNLLVITPGLTATEGTSGLARSVPAEVEDLSWAADTFNALRFGHREANLEQVQRLISLDSRVEFFATENARALNNKTERHHQVETTTMAAPGGGGL